MNQKFFRIPAVLTLFCFGFLLAAGDEALQAPEGEKKHISNDITFRINFSLLNDNLSPALKSQLWGMESQGAAGAVDFHTVIQGYCNFKTLGDKLSFDLCGMIEDSDSKTSLKASLPMIEASLTGMGGVLSSRVSNGEKIRVARLQKNDIDISLQLFQFSDTKNYFYINSGTPYLWHPDGQDGWSNVPAYLKSNNFFLVVIWNPESLRTTLLAKNSLLKFFPRSSQLVLTATAEHDTVHFQLKADNIDDSSFLKVNAELNSLQQIFPWMKIKLSRELGTGLVIDGDLNLAKIAPPQIGQ